SISPSPALPSLTTVVITDSAGDALLPGIDVVSVEMNETFLSYDFTIQFAAPPDTTGMVFLSLDLDQNLGTGAFPAPLGIGLPVFDVGSEYDIIFDIGNFLGDSLGLPPSAFALEGGDTTFTPVALAFLSFSGNSVTAQFLKGISPRLMDGDLNAACLSLSVGGVTPPDFAPNYGHGLLGLENGLSWMTEFDATGHSAIPLDATIAPGDSARFTARVVSVNPDGQYSAEIRIANNSANQPNLILPVEVTIAGLANPILQVIPTEIADTLIENSPPVIYQLTLTNVGTGTLFYFVSDTLPPGENWLSILTPVPVGQLAAGESALIQIQVDPAGLAPDQTYEGAVRIASNDASAPLTEVPVRIFIRSPLGIPGEESVPEGVVLYPNFPNPFNPVTNLRFRISDFGLAILKVYDLTGKEVKTVVNEYLAPGSYEVQWDGTDEAGRPVSSGVYLYRLEAENQVKVRKMVLMR
ncbi:MAG: T9SS C-terminal target domain-containing protein, partial [Calditrichaeota bacterium]